MTSAFNDVRTVIDLTWLRQPGAPRPPHADQPSVHFLWPAFTRQILVRRRRRRRLNLFQEHVLRLAQAGISDPDRVARLLLPAAAGNASRPQLGPTQLVRRVQAELQLLRLLDATRRPTADADDSLAGADDVEGSVTACYAFQDPWNGSMSDRFPPSLLPGLISIRWDSRGPALFGVLDQGGGRRPRERGMIVQPADVTDCPTPKPDDIVRGCDRYVGDWRVFMRPAAEDDDAGEGGNIDVAEGPSPIDEVVSIGSAEPVLLQAIAFIPERHPDALPWEAADPFGLGISRAFRDRIDEVSRLPAMDGFATWFAEQMRQARTGERATGETVTEKAGRLVDEALRGAARKYCVLHDELITLQRTALKMHACLQAGGRREAADFVRLFFGTAGIALELLLRELSGEYPTAGCYARYGLVPGEPRQSAQILNQIALEMGFAMEPSGHLPDRLTHVDAKRIRRAADVKDTALNGLIWAAVLTAHSADDKRHPLHRAAKRAPSLLLDIAELSRKRDETSHAVTRPEEYIEAVDAGVTTVFGIVRLMLWEEADL